MSRIVYKIISESEVTLSRGRGKQKLPAGSLVDFVGKYWIPESAEFGDYSEKIFKAAFSQYGLCLVSIHDIREV